METINVNPMASSRNRRIEFHKANARRVRAMKANNRSEQYNYGGISSVTVFLAIASFTFALFMYSMMVG